MIAFMATVPSTAQQSAAVAVPAVPDNIAPHPAPAQPLPFSHKTHLASGLACQLCHANPDPGAQMTLPATETCMSCHITIAKDKPAIMALREYSESGQQIPWVRVYAITPGVSWSHRAHLNAATQCETCHGDVRQVETVSETKAILAMASCIGCHRAREAAAECVTCHAWPSDRILGFE
ncbi:MAG: cytochrome c3 family protein [Woeseia sp.]